MSAMPAVKTTHISPEEYFAMAEASLERLEYVDGEVFAMSGGTERHAAIALNVSAVLWNVLRGGRCRPYAADLRVMAAEGRRYFYPDVVVSCAPRELIDGHTLKNPTVIIEVLSPSTEAYDRGAKFGSYQSIPSLRHYVLIAQGVPRVEVYTRLEDEDHWNLRIHRGLGARVALSALPCELAMADIYLDVDFDPPDEVDVGVPSSPAQP